MAKGDDRNLDTAFDKAWDNVPAPEKGKWHKAEIFVRGTNPINTYRVILRPQAQEPQG